MDFTLSKYRELCVAMLQQGYSVWTVASWLSEPRSCDRHVVLRHDVDKDPRRALKMAALENATGIHSTYYFRYTPRVFKPALIAEVARMGHEVGYHYEVLDKAHGNMDEAIQIFEEELAEFRNVAEVRTIAMHGNPLTRWDNRDLWKTHGFEDFGLVGEAYLSFDDIVYLSDTGRTWSPRNKTKDWLPSMVGRPAIATSVDSTDDVIHLLSARGNGPYYFLAHPERWAATGFEWIASHLYDHAANLAKQVIATRHCKTLMRRW